MNSISYSYDSHDTPGPVRVPEGGGGGVIAKNGTDAVKIIMIKIRDVPAKTGLLATLNDTMYSKCFCRSISRTGTV